MTEPLTLDGRAVELRGVSFGCLRRARKLIDFSGDPEDASMLVAVESAYWADSGERVFKTVVDLDAWPAAAMSELMAIIGAAADLNRPKAKPPANANGSAEEHPSPSP
jgi:hypothetical protein